MSLYGALNSGVSGLRSQANRMGIISDNISNVNTVGYKQVEGVFETLVTGQALSSQYSPGGVISNTRQSVSQQGLLTSTTNATDIAISGAGLFVVGDNTTDTATISYTRAGSFRQDELGFFRNTAGFYLRAWPLDRAGRLPGEPGNVNTNSSNDLSSLEPVNVLNATTSAAETTTVDFSANLDARRIIYPGASVIARLDSLGINDGLPAKSVIVPGRIGSQTGFTTLTSNVNSIARGDKFTVETGNGLSYTYRYGGFTYGRDVTTAAVGDNEQTLKASPLTLLATPFATTNGDNVVTVTASNHGLTTGDVITISGQTATVNNIPASEFNQSHVITVVDEDTFTITVTSDANATGSSGDTGLSVVTRPFAGNIMDASSITSRFLGTTGVSSFRTEALSFSITTETTGTLTFTYTNSTANAQLRQFNTLENLSEAINSVAGLTARVQNNRLWVGPADANEAITFANGTSVGVAGPPVQAGIDWIRELGLENQIAGDDRFNSLQSLADLVNDSSGLTAVISGVLTSASLEIFVEDPLDTVTYNDLPVASALAPFASTTPFTTTSGSRLATINHPSPHGFKTGDIVDLDLSSVVGHNPTAFSATNVFGIVNGSNTVTITQTGHGYNNGEQVYIDVSSLTGYPTGNIAGIPMTDFEANGGIFTVANITANTFEITVATNATGATGNYGAGSLLATRAYRGVPSIDFEGLFEITVTGPSTYTIQTDTAATSSGGAGGANLVVTPPNNSGSLLAELGLVDSLDGAAFTPQTLGPLGPEYNATDITKNMAGGEITPQFSQNVRIYDSLGAGHDLKVSFIKVAVNTWAVEIYSANPSELATSLGAGLLGYGNIVFNGDGSLRSVATGLAGEIPINWNNGSEQGGITFDWGTAGEPAGTAGATVIGGTDGMTQFATADKVNSVNQDGKEVGNLIGVEFTTEGVINARFSNGDTQALYRIPLAMFANPDGLIPGSGNVYAQSQSSGETNLRAVNTNGAGQLQSSTLEASTVDLAEQLTSMLVTQRTYSANSTVIRTVDQMLQTLDRLTT